MINFKKGIPVLKGCDLKISTSTTMADVQRMAPQYIKKIKEVNGFKHVNLFCNDTLNYEPENDLWLSSYGDGRIYRIAVHSIKHDILNENERKQISYNCHQWLKKTVNLQIEKFMLGEKLRLSRIWI